MSQNAAGESSDKLNHSDGNGSAPFEEVCILIVFLVYFVVLIKWLLMN